MQNNRTTAEKEIAFLRQENKLLSEKNQVLIDKCDQLQREIKVYAVQFEESNRETESLMQSHNESLTTLKKMEAKVYKSNQLSLELLKQVKDSDVEIDCLKKYIIDLKQRAILKYKPSVGDEVDMRLASYINKIQDQNKKLNSLFKRESNGVYNFGSQKINIRLEQCSEKLIVRLGRNYHSIHDFIEMYMDHEYDKLVESRNQNDFKMKKQRCITP